MNKNRDYRTSGSSALARCENEHSAYIYNYEDLVAARRMRSSRVSCSNALEHHPSRTTMQRAMEDCYSSKRGYGEFLGEAYDAVRNAFVSNPFVRQFLGGSVRGRKASALENRAVAVSGALYTVVGIIAVYVGA